MKTKCNKRLRLKDATKSQRSAISTYARPSPGEGARRRECACVWSPFFCLGEFSVHLIFVCCSCSCGCCFCFCCVVCSALLLLFYSFWDFLLRFVLHFAILRCLLLCVVFLVFAPVNRNEIFSGFGPKKINKKSKRKKQ